MYKGVSHSVPAREGWPKSLQTLIKGEGKDLNLGNNLPLVFFSFLLFFWLR